ncbi:fibronectin type III domain-containing protein [Geomesophilobacter sediminis]|uniref:Fibronectin type III domain-containing protein n=1 Tax=Geomesophilobacter sediminis TaxID=2798584 RepID=A0A8J7IR58_9BACT|nr:fibronectin type III domain-containing protein [Geomesophilobacter sediminis]MBJ6725299.1 fibronectin type III domain-containing protein [Geomesophilobacter sediminis]
MMIMLLLLGALLIGGCGDNQPWRYNPGVPAQATGLTASAGNRQVSLSWTATPGASTYQVSYSNSPSGAGSTVIANLTGTSTIVTGLTNDLPYYFAVAAVSSSGAGGKSDPVSATPSAPGPFVQADLQGTWNFNVLVTGANSKWMRGIAAIDGSGNVSVSSFVDSAGGTSAPADLFGTLQLLPDGGVLQAGGQSFHGALANNQYKDLLVATATSVAGSPMLLIGQKQVPGIVFSAADIQGTGRAVAGPLTWVYHQLSAGLAGGWEYAAGQTGKDQTETYSAIQGSTSRQLPGAGNKVVTLSITSEGVVSEALLPGAAPAPTLLLDHGIMSADKVTVVGTATDASGAPVLRIMQFIHPPAVVLTSTSYQMTDLAGNYAFAALSGGSATLWESGSFGVDSTGTLTYAAFLDSNGAATLPGSMLLMMDQQGIVTTASDASYNGKLSFFKDSLVATWTGAAGAPYLSVAVKR